MKRKAFVRTGWLKRIKIPMFPGNIKDYFDNSFLKDVADFNIEFSLENRAHKQIIFTSKTDKNIFKAIALSSQYRASGYGDRYIVPGEVSYKDSEKRSFSWPINKFKKWPKDVKTFTLRFIKALEDAYYKCMEENEAKEKIEKVFKEELRKQELEEVKSFFGEIMK